MEVSGQPGDIEDSSSTQAVSQVNQPGRWSRFTAWLARGHAALIPLILRHRSIFLGAVILLVILIEAAEHQVLLVYGARAHFLYDVLVFGLLVPAGLWILFHMLEKAESERERMVQASGLNAEFSQKLGNARSLEDLAEQIVLYAHKVAPRATATLFVLNPTTLRMLPEARCARDGSLIRPPLLNISPDSQPVASLPQLLWQSGQAPARPDAAPILVSPGVQLPSHRHDLPITRNEQLVGVLKLEYPLAGSPSALEIRTLKSAAPVMALALEGALLQNLAAQQAAASDAQRQQIAQNLHDTLAQNISYLRLKLDQLTGEHAIREIGAVLQELERMRSSADEAYQQVRNTLDELNPDQNSDLPALLVKQALVISRRANFELRSSQMGSPYALPFGTRQQVLYIVREALHNVEKHAQACQVQLQFLWLENELVIKITDDGVGFNEMKVSSDGHYGLWIMQHRAQEIGGTLKITPAEGHGTEVTLWVPRPGGVGGRSSG